MKAFMTGIFLYIGYLVWVGAEMILNVMTKLG